MYRLHGNIVKMELSEFEDIFNLRVFIYLVNHGSWNTSNSEKSYVYGKIE